MTDFAFGPESSLARIISRVTDREQLASYADELRAEIAVGRMELEYHRQAAGLARVKLNHNEGVLRAAEKRLGELA